MALVIDVVERMADGPGVVDHECRTSNAEFLVPINFLSLPDTILLAHSSIGIRQEFDAYAFLVAKLGVLQTVIPTDAEQHTVMAEKIVFVIGEVGHFRGTARRSILRIEKNHDVLTLEAGQI